MTSHGNFYGETLGRGSGKGKEPEETLSLLSFTNSKKACVAEAGGGGGKEHQGNDIGKERGSGHLDSILSEMEAGCK